MMIFVDAILAFLLGCQFPFATTLMEVAISGIAAVTILLLLQKVRYIGSLAIFGQGAYYTYTIASKFIKPHVEHIEFAVAGGIILFVIYTFCNAEQLQDNVDDFSFDLVSSIANFIGHSASICHDLMTRLGSKVKVQKKKEEPKHTDKKDDRIKFYSKDIQGGSLDDLLDQVHEEMEQQRIKREHEEYLEYLRREREKLQRERERIEREQRERAWQQQAFKEQQDRARKEHEQNQQRRSNISFFKGCKNLSELEAAYKKLAKKLHPDNGGNSEDFARMSSEYERLKKAM